MENENATTTPTTPTPAAAWTTGQKVGWFFVGALGSVVGILIASLCNVGHPDRPTATKMAICGLAAVVILSLLLSLATCGASLAAITSIASQ